MFDQYESVIFVGCHLGAYIPALHWLCRRVEGLRMVVQRPSHVGDMLATRFADEAGPFPQSLMLLRRGLSPAEGARRVLTARSALRAGLSLYLCGDIPWPKGYEVECLGSHPRFSGLWADLAAETRRPVVLVFARFEPGGRYRVELDAPFSVDPSNISWAVTHYARRLDRAVATFPEQAVAYWTWPAYDPHAVEKTRSKNEDDNAHVVAHTQYQARSISGIPVAQTLPALRGPVA
jgi:lauroyl/myristoyl acyltransferase